LTGRDVTADGPWGHRGVTDFQAGFAVTPEAACVSPLGRHSVAMPEASGGCGCCSSAIIGFGLSTAGREVLPIARGQGEVGD